MGEDDDAAQWADAAKEQLLENGPVLGEAWKDLVGAWYAREEAADFKKLVSTARTLKKGGAILTHIQPAVLPTKGRPTQIATWVKNARAARYAPAIADVAAFGTQVEAWWQAVNPPWRKIGSDGEVIEDGAAMTRTEGADWGKMSHTGPNALLNVLKCLQWWAGAAQNAPSERWVALVDDVRWVLGAMERYVASSP
ncbi:hypothetical protein GGX14DRAFT_381679 [Mycena pura]|uniref:Uncharacterized protein n=1 Tax=Mycena pura TaxID=153505 RepID=A0AAD6UN84_9AGAR|nr:hypothetical protein GGX14DRAFT_381679 [Mycena pura]